MKQQKTPKVSWYFNMFICYFSRFDLAHSMSHSLHIHIYHIRNVCVCSLFVNIATSKSIGKDISKYIFYLDTIRAIVRWSLFKLASPFPEMWLLLELQSTVMDIFMMAMRVKVKTKFKTPQLVVSLQSIIHEGCAKLNTTFATHNLFVNSFTQQS